MPGFSEPPTRPAKTYFGLTDQVSNSVDMTASTCYVSGKSIAPTSQSILSCIPTNGESNKKVGALNSIFLFIQILGVDQISCFFLPFDQISPFYHEVFVLAVFPLEMTAGSFPHRKAYIFLNFCQINYFENHFSMSISAFLFHFSNSILTSNVFAPNTSDQISCSGK